MEQVSITLIGEGIQNSQELNIQISVVAKVNIDAKTAQRKVTAWLISEVGNMLVGNAPHLLISQQTTWRVPIMLTASSKGVVGQVGYVEVDAETGLLQTNNELATEILNNVNLLTRSTQNPIS